MRNPRPDRGDEYNIKLGFCSEKSLQISHAIEVGSAVGDLLQIDNPCKLGVFAPAENALEPQI